MSGEDRGGADGGRADRAADGGGANREFDLAVRVILPEPFAEVAGAVLMDLLGPFQLEIAGVTGVVSPAAGRGPVAPATADPDKLITLVFYPSAGVVPTLDELLAALPAEVRDSGRVTLETREVSRDWVEGWREHFRPIVVGGVRIRPPWEPASEDAAPVDVVINPGLGFGTGLHPTTRGTLQLLQLALPRGSAQRRKAAQRREAIRRGEHPSGGPRGPLVDVGTGSGILAITAAKSGWGPVVAFDNDPDALLSARENVEANGVQETVEVHEADVAGASPDWFVGATVLANMTLEPVVALMRKLAAETAPAGLAAPAPGGIQRTAEASTGGRPRRVVVSGILAGAQEFEMIRVAVECGFLPGQRLYEAEWVSVELLPAPTGGVPIGGFPVSEFPPGGGSVDRGS